MMNIISRLGFTLWFSLLLIMGCSADVPQAPTNQIIKGPFTITKNWQTITFDAPLKTIPHIQFIELMLDRDKYEPAEDIEEDEFHAISASYKRTGEDKAIKVAVILVDNEGREFRATVTSSGVRTTELGTYGNLSLSPNGDKGKFYYPKNTEFVAIKIKANMEIQAEYLSWHALLYYQAPNDTWKDVKQSEIVSFN